MKIGYVYETTGGTSLSAQITALKTAGCAKIYQEKTSDTDKKHPQRQNMLEQLQPGDVVLVWKLDRLAHSLRDIIAFTNEIQKKGAGLRSLDDCLDTTAPDGRQVFQTFAALAEFDRNVVQQRTKAGLRAARARGRKGGRPKGLSEQAQQIATQAEKLYLEGALSTTEICARLSISRSTLYNYLRHQGVAVGSVPK